MPLTTGKHITLLRDTMDAAIAYGLALEKAQEARDTLEGFLDSCRHTGAGDAAVETILSFVTATEEDRMLAPGYLAEQWAERDEDPAPAVQNEPTVPSAEDRFGKAPEGFEWLDCAGLCDREGNEDPGLADCALMLAPAVCEEYPDGGHDVPWRLQSGLGHHGTGWDLPCAVLDLMEHLGRPSDSEAVLIELAPSVEPSPTPPGCITGRMIPHERPAS